ncbi:ATP-dependent DNA helicase RecG [Alkaliphilus metalliredigens QYMF]|uniref:ATP-dependent DNA helicase RecG n=2 Tax=Alkaliphilus TaxID=114627 RepID=A6TRV3_ALKMQ|nr:ATP-dependent DNA helicase RecG [Alkaliphilus metalliredigens QYMF]
MKDSFEENIQFIKGVGPKKAARLKRLNIETVQEMLYHFPRDYDDRRNTKKVSHLVAGEKVTIYGRIIEEPQISKIRKGLSLTKVKMRDDTGSVSVIFFNQPFLKKNLTMGTEVMVNGKVKVGYKGLEITNPVYERVESANSEAQVIPIYSTTEGLTQKEIYRMQKQLLSTIKEFPEFLPEEIIKKNRLCDLRFALCGIHFPKTTQDLKVAKYRLVFDEFFLLNLSLLSIKKQFKKQKSSIALHIKDDVYEFIQGLPFRLTSAQRKTLDEIFDDIQRTTPMNRLVQGDVGSGKTIVAVCALLNCVLNGYQGAMMAPTEILAEQHYEALKELLSPLNIEVGLLVGSMTKKNKERLLERIAKGEVQIVTGTHALIQEGVVFHNLALAVTDEQHRFGVRQRASLMNKGANPHILVMTATPIPRTLALIVYGDLDISTIDELPPGRKSIKTFSASKKKREDVYTFIKKELDNGRQAYVVCPLVEESESIEAESATEIATLFSHTIFKSYRVGLLHGKMPSKEKETVMNAFKRKEIDILVSTTVIEVGVNVPNATVMIIENAERFGLAQLHQLRGRVGRGDSQSYCILIHNSKSDIAKERMKIMEKTTDGFLISEKDLELRGPGEFFGIRQHGLPELKIANLFKHIKILKIVQQQIKELIEVDFEGFLKEHPALEKKLINQLRKIDDEIPYS